MAIDKKVNTRFTAKDGITKRFGIMDRAAARFGRTANKSFRMVNRRASKFQSITGGFLKAQVIGKGFGLLSRGIGSVTTDFIAFDKAALGATVRFKDIGPNAANFNEQLKIIRKSAREAGATTEFTAAQAGESLDFLARAGFSSAEAMGSLKSMIDLSTASGEDFAQVADMSSDLLGAFGLNAKDTGQKIANLNRLNDVLVKSSNSANVTIEDMFETMKIAAPIATTLGIGLEEVAALTAVMGNAGIKGSMGATALKNSMLNLATQKKPVVDMLRAIGAEIKTGDDGSLLFTETLAGITDATKGMGKLKVAKVFDVIFGKRAIAGASNLSRNISDVKEFRKSLDAAGLSSQRTAEIMRTSIDAKLKSLGSAATEAGFKVLNAFEGDGKKGIDSFTDAIRNADMTDFIASLKVIAGFVSTIATGFVETGKGLGIIAAKFSLEQERVGASQFEPSNFFGGLREKATEAITPPNKAEAAARAQQGSFRGRLDIAGAPPGSSVSTTAGAFQKKSGFDINLLGANP